MFNFVKNVIVAVFPYQPKDKKILNCTGGMISNVGDYHEVVESGIVLTDKTPTVVWKKLMYAFGCNAVVLKSE
jgi:hypothetical protein